MKIRTKDGAEIDLAVWRKDALASQSYACVIPLIDAIEAMLGVPEKRMDPGYSERNYHISGYNEAIDAVHSAGGLIQEHT